MFLLYYIFVLYINSIYYITFRINSKYLSSQEYRTTITMGTIIIYIYIAQYPANTACSTRL